MFTKLALKLFGLAIRSTYKIGLTTFDWNFKKKLIVPSNSRISHISWKIVRLLIWLHQVFIIVRLYQSQYRKDMKIINHVLQWSYSVAFTVPTVAEIALTHMGDDIVVALNQVLRFFKNMQDTYKKEGAPERKHGCENYIALLLLICIIQPLMMLVFFARRPHAPIFISSIFDTKTLSPMSFLMLGFIEYWFMATGWGCLVLVASFVLVYICSLSFWLDEIKANKQSLYTTELLRRPGNVLLTYRCFYLLTKQMNEFIGPYLAILGNSVSATIAVMCNYVLIRHHSYVSPIGFIPIIVVIVACLSYIWVANVFLGECFKSSKGFLTSWQRNTNLKGADKKLIGKYIKSCQLLKFKVREFGFFQKSGVLRGVARIIFYTVKLLASMSKLH